MNIETTTGDMPNGTFIPFPSGNWDGKWHVTTTGNPTNNSWTPELDKLKLELAGHKKALKDVIQERDRERVISTQWKSACDEMSATEAAMRDERDYLRQLLNQMTALAPTLEPNRHLLYQRPLTTKL